jgi:hypothetical protein
MRHSVMGSQPEWGEAWALGKDSEADRGHTLSSPSRSAGTVTEGGETGGEEGSGGSVSLLLEEETERSITEEEAPASHCDSEEEHVPVEGDGDRWEEEGNQGTSPPPSTEGGRERASRRGRSRRRTRVRDRAREAAGHLTSRSYSFHDNGRKVITSFTHLGLAGREEGLDYFNF